MQTKRNVHGVLLALQDINVCNKYELQNIESMLAATGGQKYVSNTTDCF
jgi:hypothetical protein